MAEFYHRLPVHFRLNEAPIGLQCLATCRITAQSKSFARRLPLVCLRPQGVSGGRTTKRATRIARLRRKELLCRLHWKTCAPAWLSGRALASHARGHKFESYSGHQYIFKYGEPTKVGSPIFDPEALAERLGIRSTSEIGLTARENPHNLVRFCGFYVGVVFYSTRVWSP